MIFHLWETESRTWSGLYINISWTETESRTWYGLYINITYTESEGLKRWELCLDPIISSIGTCVHIPIPTLTFYGLLTVGRSNCGQRNSLLDRTVCRSCYYSMTYDSVKYNKNTWPWTIVWAMFGECHVSCILTTTFVDFKLEKVDCSCHKRVNFPLFIPSLHTFPVAVKFIAPVTP